MASTIISAQDIYKTFRVGDQDIEILKGVTFSVESGDLMVIFGPSGCGKSTLLHTILGLEEPSRGIVTFLGKNLYEDSSEDFRSDFRKQHIGMVYQQPNWIKSLSVEENIAFPLLLLGQDKLSSLVKAKEILTRIEMADWARHVPTELSSGQQQRIALARALITNPEVIIADEPTGNLDFESGQALMQLLADLNQKQGTTIIMVTHDLEYLKFARTAIKMLDGKIDDQYKQDDRVKMMSEIKSKRGIKNDANA